MLDIKQEIRVLLLRKGLSMRKMLRLMEEDGHKRLTIGNFSKMLSKKTIKFEKVQEILDFLGYELEIKEK